MLDMHCHILPAGDDGARDVAESVAMLRCAAACGIDRIIATSHVYKRASQVESIRAAYAQLLPEAEKLGIDLRLGYEVNYRAVFVGLTDRYDLSLDQTGILLLELPEADDFPDLEYWLRTLLQKYRVVIAHPERLGAVQRDVRVAMSMRRLGCEMQLDADAFFAPLMSRVRRTARAMMDQNCVDYIASDAHNAAAYATFGKAVKRLGDRWPTGGALGEAVR